MATTYVVHENTAHSQPSRDARGHTSLSSIYRNSAAVLPWMLCAATLMAAGPVLAGGVLPTNGQYVAGQGSITSSAGSVTVNQSSSHGIINWQGFSIGQGNSVLFNNGNGATLNRVTGNQISQIDGSLSATGSVYLINPQGIVIGPSGQVIANGSFVASTRDVSNNAFMSGQPFSASGTSNGSVINEGVITSNNGDAILVGSSVTNSGTISAPNGTVGLAAGNEITLQPAGSDARIAISGGTGSVTNSGNLRAAQAELNAAGGNVYALVENNGGAISATGTQTINGHVWLTAGGTGTVTIAGAINAQNANGSGGDVTVRATNISLPGSINASATSATGAGGSVSVVASNSASVTGTIHARGGASGQGGSIETSGHSLSFGGANIDAGKGGNWLLDPYDLTVDSTAATTINASLGQGTSVELQTTATNASGPGNQNASGVGDINIESVLSWNTSATLTLDAFHSLNILAPINVNGGGLVLQYNDAATDGVLNFGLTPAGFTGSVNFAAGTGEGIAGQSLTINGNAYTLLYSMSDVQAINNNLTGTYALANSLDASSVTNWVTLGTDGHSDVQNSGNGFAGTFEGLGNTISNLTINLGETGLIGLFGYSSGTISDIGVVGGSFSGLNTVGALVGHNAGTITNAYATSAIESAEIGGGLVGIDSGTITNAYATGPVTLASGGYAGGLIGDVANAVITNVYATGAVSASGANDIGGLVGYANAISLHNAYATGAVNAGNSQNVGGLVGYANGGTIANSYAAGTVTGGSDVGGLVGGNESGEIVNAYATGAVTGTDSVGGLVGFNDSTVTDAYAMGAVTGLSDVGGLVGTNDAEISNVYATGAVTGTSTTGTSSAGGLVGTNDSAIINAYAMGAVTAAGANAGGLVGTNNSEIINAYSTGTVSGGSGVGGLVGAGNGFVEDGYWNTDTSGIPASHGSIGSGETTAQLQGALPSGFGTDTFGVGIWGTGTGLYPYFLWQYPTGTPQFISGTAYADAGNTILNAGTVSLFAGSESQGAASIGSNGYYYALLLPGTSANTTLLAYESAGGNGAHLDTITGSTAGFDIWNNVLIAPTSALTYSTATATPLQTQDAALIAQATGSGADPVASLTNYGYIATGPFTLDQSLTLSNSLYVAAEGANASITVAAPITLQGANKLELNAAGALTIDAAVTVSGAGNVVLGAGHDTTSVPGASLLELSFGLTSSGFAGSLNFAAGSGEGIAGQSLTINGAPYTLLYSMGDVQNINNNLGGNFALATSLNAATDPTTPANWTPIGTNYGFYGIFEGLGHTISNLTVNTGGGYAGLFGSVHGTVRDIGLTGSVSGSYSVGGLAGTLGGTISNSYFSGTVDLAATGNFNVGGLVGSSNGTITNSYTTGTVTDGGYNYLVGGLAGSNNGTIDRSYSTATINGGIGTVYVGGLAGKSYASISNSYFAGTVNAGASIAVGGLVGSNPGTLSNSFYDVDQVLINGGHLLTAGGIYDAQYQDWIGHNQSLDIANYFAAPDTNGVYSIGSAQDLINLLGFAEVPGLAFKLTQNIDLGGNPGLFIPYFAGASLDGQGHVVSNLTVDEPLSENVGLIGQLVSGTIENIGVVDAGVSGHSGVGALVGYNNAGSVTNAYATGTVAATGGGYASNIGGLEGYSGGSISNSYAAVTVNAGANSSDIGGLVGEVFGADITSSYATGAVTGGANTNYIGGLVGFMSGNITGSHAGGAVTGGYGSNNVGGLVGIDVSGYSQASGYQPYAVSISNSYATGAVNGGVNSQNVGGLIGSIGSSPGGNVTVANDYATGAVTGGGYVGGLVGNSQSYGGTPIITTSYSIGAVSGTSNVGGLVGANGGVVSNSYWNLDTSGQANSAGGTGLTNAQMMTASSFSSWTFGGLGSGATWVLVDADGSINNGNGAAGATTPMLLSEYSTAISTPHQLQLIALAPSANYTLANDIDMTSTEGGSDVWSLSGFVPINISGSLNGAGFTISKLYEDNTANTGGYGLFRSIRAGGSVDDLVIEAANITGANNVGALAGANYGTIENVLVQSDGATPTTITGSGNIGGLVGMNVGTIGGVGANFSDGDGLMAGFDGAVGAIANVSGQSLVGGLVGWNRGTITGGGASANSFAVADVSGLNEVGGFVGWNDGAVTGGLVYSVNVTGTGSGIGGFVGLNAPTGNIQASGVTGNNQAGTLASAGTVQGPQAVGGFAGANEGTLSQDSVFQTDVGTSSTLWSGGFVGWNTGSATIADSTVTFSGVAGSDAVGGFVGLNQAAITTSSAQLAAVDVAHPTSVAAVRGVYNVGGFAGSNMSAGTITNSQSSIQGGGPITATSDLVGGFAGTNVGSLSGDQSSAAVSGPLQTGGFVGWNEAGGTISNSSATGAVTGGSESGGFAGWNTGSLSGDYATGAVSGTYDVGGLVGINQSSIVNAYATGSVGSALAANAGGLVGQNSGSINDVYASGAVTGRAGTTGALVGDNISTGSITNAYIDTAITGSLAAAGTNFGTLQVTAIGGTGEPDPTLQATYVGFDFTNVWTIAPGDMPTLLHAP